MVPSGFVEGEEELVTGEGEVVEVVWEGVS